MRRWMLAVFASLALALAAQAQPVDFPGLSRDAARYQQSLEARFPTGAPQPQRALAEQRAAAAERRGDWPAAAQAWEERVAMGEARPDQWLALARAQLRRAPPEAARAAQAGWQAFALVPAGPPEIPALLVIADAMQRLDRPLQQLNALRWAVEREPANAALQRQLAEARRAAGMLVAGMNIEPEAEPARACLRFTVPPARRGDWQPGDWVRTEPPLPGLAVTREGESLCVAGLPHGQTTRIVLRQGLPAEDGLRLARDTPVPVAMPDRAPRLAFDTRAFLLPRGQEAQGRQLVPLALVNVSSARLDVVRIAERALVPFGREWRPGQAMDWYTAENLPEEWGRVVWSGAVELPRGLEPNRAHRIAVPVPAAARQHGPGLYALVLRGTDGGGERVSRVAVQPLMVTDLGLTAWRGAGGLAVQARGLHDARPAEGVRVALLARSNEVLAEATTAADGLARFGAPLLRGRGAAAPVAVHASRGDDLVALDLEAASFDLSDRGAEGRPHPGPLDAFLWLDRGIYRPGETVQAMALIRDAGGRPVDLPARLRLRRPNGSLAAEFTPNPSEGAALHWPVALAQGAPAGQWRLDAHADPDAPPIGSVTFRVDAFVPERLAVELTQPPGALTPGRELPVGVGARFLYGAPGAGLTGVAELRLVVRRDPSFPGLAGFLFGLDDEVFAPDLLTFELGALDAQGRGTIPVLLPRAPDTTRPLFAELTVTVDEPGGGASRATAALPVAAAQHLLGIRPLFEGGAVDAGAEAAFEIVATDALGVPQPARLRLRLVRERPDWRVVVRGAQARFETVWRDEPVDAVELAVTAGDRGRFARTLPFGRYRLEVEEAGGMALASLRFRAGWAGGENAEVPDKVDVSADRRTHAPGETARLRIAPPFAGRASVAVLTDGLLSLRELDVPEGGAEVEVPVDAAWGAGAHVAVTVFRPGEAADGAPGRALGLAWLQAEPAARRIEVALTAPERARPNSRVEVQLHIQGAREPARVTLAAVDEGILRLTRFASPDPIQHFLGRRALGTDIRDDYGRLVRPTEGAVAALRQGGDEFGALGALPIPRRNVALFHGPVATGPDGRATITLDLPDFAGELRLMAVAWEGERIGAGSRAMVVRDALLAEAAPPRFLAPGDEARVPVLLHNLELPAGEVAAMLTASGALAGEARVAASLATGARAQQSVALRATGEGDGVIRLVVTGPGGFRAEREQRITVRSPRGVATASATQTIPPGGELRVAPDAARFVAGSWRATARFGAPVRYDADGMLQALLSFPMACTEQLASQAIGLAAALDEATPDRAPRLQRAVDGVLARQRYDGVFGLWSAQADAQPWASAYAVEALLRARAAGAAVAAAALTAALDALDEDSEGTADEPERLAAQAARLHALALGGRVRLGAARRLWESLEQLPTPLARAQLGAVFARAGDAARAERAFAAALAAPARRDWIEDYGSAARDALALLVLLRESGAPAAQVQQAQARLPGPELRPELASTQEQAWAVLAAAALGRDSRPVRVALDGAAIAPAPVVARALTGPAVARNLGDAPLSVTVSIAGLPADALPAARNGMRITRRFLGLDGQQVNLDALRIGHEFVLLLEGGAETRQDHLAMATQGLPAGFEITARLGPGPVPGMPWLGELTAANAQPALDDRLAAAITLSPQQPSFRLAARLRATTAGRFELPGAEVLDMYRPAFFARQNTGRVGVAE